MKEVFKRSFTTSSEDDESEFYGEEYARLALLLKHPFVLSCPFDRCTLVGTRTNVAVTRLRSFVFSHF